MLEKGDYSKFTIQGAKVRLFFDITKYFLKKIYFLPEVLRI